MFKARGDNRQISRVDVFVSQPGMKQASRLLFLHAAYLNRELARTQPHRHLFVSRRDQHGSMAALGEIACDIAIAHNRALSTPRRTEEELQIVGVIDNHSPLSVVLLL